jgi:hypothetical protein
MNICNEDLSPLVKRKAKCGKQYAGKFEIDDYCGNPVDGGECGQSQDEHPDYTSALTSTY